MERKAVMIGGLALALVVMGVLAWHFFTGRAQSAGEFYAPALCDLVARDPAGAESALRDTPISVEGLVRQVGSEGENSFLELDGSPHGTVRCIFEGVKGLQIVNLEPGEEVRVQGALRSIGGGVVTIHDCRLEQ
ncbi:MAG: OB-fold nucleic acid binding domain-containing protein [Planctomycetota bacterium]